jgi:hypothetical protein
VLERGDLLLLMSDGIPEATVDGEVFLGEEAIREIVLAHAKESLPDIRGKILGSVEQFLHGGPLYCVKCYPAAPPCLDCGWHVMMERVAEHFKKVHSH